MPLFRRRSGPELEGFTVGSQGHQVVPGSRPGGIEQLAGLGDYVDGISRRRPPGPDGRDTIAVLNAKMDHAEAVNDLADAAVLACEELVERGLLDPAAAPAGPPHARMPEYVSTYGYIQLLHERAQARRAWLEEVDALLRANHVLLLAPAPVEG
jgi:hypothetical protein